MTASSTSPLPPDDSNQNHEGAKQHNELGEYNPHESPAMTAKRYRSSNYFLADQLKTSEALNDFRLTKTIVQNMPQFSLRHQLDFAIRYANLSD